MEWFLCNGSGRWAYAQCGRSKYIWTGSVQNSGLETSVQRETECSREEESVELMKSVWNFINLPTNLWTAHGSAAQRPNRGVWMKAGQLGFRVLPPIVPAGFCITPEWPLSKQAWFIKQPPPSSRAAEPVYVLKKRVNASVRPAGPLSRATGRNFNELVGLFLIGIKEWNCSDCKSC